MCFCNQDISSFLKSWNNFNFLDIDYFSSCFIMIPAISYRIPSKVTEERENWSTYPKICREKFSREIKQYATYKDFSTRELNGRSDDENKIKKEPDPTEVETT